MTFAHYIRLRADLMEHEGLRLTEYDDKTGKPSYGQPVQGKRTIGYGYNVTDGDRHLLERVLGGPYHGVIDQSQAKRLLEAVLLETEDELLRKRAWLRQLAAEQPIRYAVLLNMAYNLGVPKLLGFRTTLRLVQEGHYLTAASAMLDSAWAKQVGVRARRLSDQMAVGVYTSPQPAVW